MEVGCILLQAREHSGLRLSSSKAFSQHGRVDDDLLHGAPKHDDVRGALHVLFGAVDNLSSCVLPGLLPWRVTWQLQGFYEQKLQIY